MAATIPNLVLYNSPVSTCSQKVRMALAEKELPWTDRVIVFSRGDHLTEDYLALNPNGVVPTLLHDDVPIIDSSVINEYLEDVFPARPLRPAKPVEVARMRAWRQYIDEVPTASIRPLSFNAHFVRIWDAMSDEEFRGYVERLPLRKHFYRKMGRKGFSKEEIDESLERLRQTLERMERSLEQTQWLAHDTFTLADISIMPTIVRMEDLGLEYMWKELPRVTEWYARIRERPAYAKAYGPGSRELSPSC
jgi:glutathione S-transferase